MVPVATIKRPIVIAGNKMSVSRAGNFPLRSTATSARSATSQKRLEEHSTPKADRPQKNEKDPEPASLAEE